MKTNVTLKSVDRNLFGIVVRHRTKPDMLCLNDLQRSYDINRKKHEWDERRISNILNIDRSRANAERIYYVLKERGLVNTHFRAFTEQCEKETLIKTLKKMGLYNTYGRGDKRETWCHPDIFTLISLELNPMFYAKTVTWLTDGLIYNRINAGDMNVIFRSRIYRFFNPDADFYMRINRGLNHLVKKTHYSGIRNTMSEADLKDLENLQIGYAHALDMGLVKSKERLIELMIEEYHRRHSPKFKI